MPTCAIRSYPYLPPLGTNAAKPGRALRLMVGGGTDHVYGMEAGQFQGDHLAADGFLHPHPLLGRLVETVAEAVGDSHVLPCGLPIVATLVEQGGGFQGVVFFRP